MKSKILKLLRNDWFFHFLIFVIFFPAMYWGMDPRLAMSIFGALLIAVAWAHYIEVDEEHPRLEGLEATFIGANRIPLIGHLQRGVSIFIMAFGVFMIVAMIIMFIRGERLGMSS